MNKSEIADALAERLQVPKVRAQSMVGGLFDIMTEALQSGQKVTISDFGTFSISSRKAFEGHNPRTGETIPVPSRKIPVFKAGKGLKAAMNAE